MYLWILLWFQQLLFHLSLFYLYKNVHLYAFKSCFLYLFQSAMRFVFRISVLFFFFYSWNTSFWSLHYYQTLKSPFFVFPQNYVCVLNSSSQNKDAKKKMLKYNYNINIFAVAMKIHKWLHIYLFIQEYWNRFGKDEYDEKKKMEWMIQDCHQKNECKKNDCEQEEFSHISISSLYLSHCSIKKIHAIIQVSDSRNDTKKERKNVELNRICSHPMDALKTKIHIIECNKNHSDKYRFAIRVK